MQGLLSAGFDLFYFYIYIKIFQTEDVPPRFQSIICVIGTCDVFLLFLLHFFPSVHGIVMRLSSIVQSAMGGDPFWKKIWMGLCQISTWGYSNEYAQAFASVCSFFRTIFFEFLWETFLISKHFVFWTPFLPGIIFCIIFDIFSIFQQVAFFWNHMFPSMQKKCFAKKSVFFATFLVDPDPQQTHSKRAWRTCVFCVRLCFLSLLWGSSPLVWLCINARTFVCACHLAPRCSSGSQSCGGRGLLPMGPDEPQTAS